MLRGVPEEVAEINEELESIEYFINHTDRMVVAAGQYNKDGLKKMVKHMREATLRIEEVTEDYMNIQQQQPPSDPGCGATTNFIKTMIPRLRVSYEIQDIKSSIVDIKERFDSLEQGSCFRQIKERSCFEKGSSSESQNVPPQHTLQRNALYVEEDDVVGFEAPRDEVIGWLKERREDRTVIVVVGMGGQGKTTLAKTVYDKVIRDFDCHAWIEVSPTYTLHGLFRAMLDKFNERNEEISKMGLDSLVKEVRKYLQMKRYVFFFDDVWNKDFWTEIEPIVFDNKKESRIVITTRNMEVAKLCKVSSFVHILNLQPLSPQQSMELFFKKAFRNEPPGGECPTWLEDISSNLLKNCKGLPLAIVSIGNLLTLDKSSPKLQFLCKSLIFELDWNQCSFRISNTFCLSYDDLPFYLKPCLLYFGIYPKDYKVKHKRLIRHWVAEGFVKFKSHKTLEDDAEQYLKELMDRSLVQISSFSIYGKPKTYSVHFLVHDMILKKIKDMNFCHFVNHSKNDPSLLSWKIRRLQIETNPNDYWNVTNIEGSLIRSLYVFQEEELPKEFVRKIPAKYKQLRVFDFENNKLKYIPQNFCSLIHLRYLSFRNTKVHTLPGSIGNLHNLESLDIKLTKIQEMPREITNLTKLRHLLVDGLQIMEGVGDLKSLQTLRDVEIGNPGKELEKLRQLRVLGLILDEQNYLSACSSINKMQHLEKLFINASEVDESIDWGCLSPMPALQKLHLEGQLKRFPEWIPKHQNLVALTLRFSNLTDPLKPLIHLPNLLSLSLIMAYGGETLRFKNGELPKLRKLVLKELHLLDSIDINEGALPSLEKLMLHNIPYFIQVPSGINHLGKLQVLCIDEMPREFVDRIRENIWINNNVRQVTISNGKKIGRY
ncbi:hypothetical protein TanjilG_02533 [Lupinus angustifolius]|uniref:Uncharacterized protein n=2 Tax=Lupinus angustifolius TaxID=3871 RepID=A0A394DDX5_LUPAN|nr:hypothetical protein TanjilG_02533 [Lupinus angustifolius]